MRKTKTENDVTLPYDDPLHARLHDWRYSIAPVVAGHTEFEIRTVSALAEWHGDRLSRPPRWLDFACGAGFHQRNAGGKMERVGLERPKAMLDADRARKGHEARFIHREVPDGSNKRTVPRADFVMHFRFGYIHRENPERCMEMILAMVAKVRPGGRFLPGVNPLPLDVPGQLATAFGPVTIDSVRWRFPEPEVYGYDATHCLHPDWIAGTVAACW